MKKIGIILMAMIGINVTIYAQQHEVLTHYITNPYLYNPARVGQSKYIDVSLLYRKQWLKVPDAPDTKILTVQGMIKNKFGVGAKLYMDKVHIIQNFGAKFSYAYYIRMKKNPDDHYLSIGLAAGFKTQNIRFDQAIINHPDDPSIFYNGVQKTIFDADAGINYYMKGLNIGLGVSNLAPLSYNYESNTNSLQYKSIYHLYGNVSYDIRMGKKKDLTLKPSILVRYVPNIPTQFDGSLLFDYKNIFWVGGGYRYKNVGVWGMAGVRIFDMVSIGYAYEQSLDGNQSALGSTHEFTVGFRIMPKVGKHKNMFSQDDYLAKFEAQLDSMKQAQKAIADKNEKLEKEVKQQQLEAQKQQNSNNTTVVKKDGSSNESYINNFDKKGEISFEKNASNLYAQHKVELDKIYNEIKPLIEQKKLVMLHLVGSASIEGTSEQNLILSSKRVENIRLYFIEKGVPESLISSTFKGNSEALVKNQLDGYVKGVTDDSLINANDRNVRIYVLTK